LKNKRTFSIDVIPELQFLDCHWWLAENLNKCQQQVASTGGGSKKQKIERNSAATWDNKN